MEERGEISDFTWDLIEKEVKGSIEEGLFDQRLDRVLARTPVVLDEDGWRELSELHIRPVLPCSRFRPAPARSMQIAFEHPPAENDLDQG